ncbi:MAG: hypothetical protein Kow0069_33990 [Promethearchaeota archaeon]
MEPPHTRHLLEGKLAVDATERTLIARKLLHVEGPPASGKTTLAYLLAGKAVERGDRVAWIDCDGAFSPRRFASLFGANGTRVLERVLVARPVGLPHLALVVRELRQIDWKRVVVDTISENLRAALSSNGSSRSEQVHYFHDQVLVPLLLEARERGADVVLVHQETGGGGHLGGGGRRFFEAAYSSLEGSTARVEFVPEARSECGGGPLASGGVDNWAWGGENFDEDGGARANFGVGTAAVASRTTWAKMTRKVLLYEHGEAGDPRVFSWVLP